MKKIIGIAGGTASGKSTFTDKLAEKLESDGLSVRTIHMDSFFRPEEERPHVASHLSGKVYVDDNCPDTVDLPVLHNIREHLQEVGFTASKETGDPNADVGSRDIQCI